MADPISSSPAPPAALVDAALAGAASVAPAAAKPTTSVPAADPSGTGEATAGAAPAAPATPAESPAARSRAISREAAARKALNDERAKLAAERQALQSQAARAKELDSSMAEFKKDPLGWAEKNGVTYEEMTRAAIGRTGQQTPEARIAALEAQLKRDALAAEQARQRAEAQAQQTATQQRIDAYISGIVSYAETNKDAYELIGKLEKDYAQSTIYEVADEYAKRTGKVLTAKEACDMLEDYLVGEGVKYAQSKKVAAKLVPATGSTGAAPDGKAAPAAGGVAGSHGAGVAAAAPAEDDAEVVDPSVDTIVQAQIDRVKKREAANRRTPSTLTNKDSTAPTRPENQPQPNKMTRKEALEHARRTVWGPRSDEVS